MQREVYKSLDRSPSYFGMKGLFLLIFIGGVVVSILLGLVIGMLIDSIVGFIAGFGGCALSYLGVIAWQEHMDEFDIQRWMSGQGGAKFISVSAGERRRTAQAVRDGSILKDKSN